MEEDQRHGEEIFSQGIQKNSNYITMDKVSCLFTSLTLKLTSSTVMFSAMFFTNPHCPKIPKDLASIEKIFLNKMLNTIYFRFFNNKYRFYYIGEPSRLLCVICKTTWKCTSLIDLFLHQVIVVLKNSLQLQNCVITYALNNLIYDWYTSKYVTFIHINMIEKFRDS